MHAQLRSFDKQAAHLVDLLPRWLDPVMRGATFVGLPAVVVSLAAAVAAISWTKGKYRIAYAQLASVGALIIDSILKLLVHRDRPHTIYA
jgi:hypothetical protein